MCAGQRGSSFPWLSGSADGQWAELFDFAAGRMPRFLHALPSGAYVAARAAPPMPHDRGLDRTVHTSAPRRADRTRGRGGLDRVFDDVERTHRALTAPGVTTRVATAGRQLLGSIQVPSDGLIRAHVSMLLIARNSRGLGVGPKAAAARPRARGRRAAGRPHSDRGLPRAAWSERSLGFRPAREDLRRELIDPRN